MEREESGSILIITEKTLAWLHPHYHRETLLGGHGFLVYHENK